MRVPQLFVTVILCSAIVLMVAMPNLAYAQSFVQYKVQINADGSSAWTITKASDLNGTIDTWQGFQQRISTLVMSAANLTQREMGVDPNSLQLNTAWGNQSQTTVYQFTWLNCSMVQNDRIIFGDIFKVTGFFGQLYGDGELQIVYPANYTNSTVSPQPNGGNSAPNTLDWLGTDFFVNGNPSIVLVPVAPSPTPNRAANGFGWQTYIILGAGLALAGAVLSIGIYLFRRRNSATEKTISSSLPPAPPIFESEEGKVLRLLQSNGGSAFQSAITDQCRFSKSKTSQLLSALERKGVVTRYKKGRDKIVTLTKQNNSKGDLR
ncbi:MAG TPA: hypothetical protein VLV84_01805 [Candidatus Acidoferrales bacterium]|nr:hypothetical protein [Candidatus Acidoferrales bacterium]